MLEKLKILKSKAVDFLIKLAFGLGVLAILAILFYLDKVRF